MECMNLRSRFHHGGGSGGRFSSPIRQSAQAAVAVLGPQAAHVPVSDGPATAAISVRVVALWSARPRPADARADESRGCTRGQNVLILYLINAIIT